MPLRTKPAIGNFAFYSMLAIIFIWSISLQTFSLLSPDVSWAMHLADRLLHGGKYYVDFFENNPPLVIYLMVPAVLLAKLLQINFIIAARIYIFLIAALSLWLCWVLARKMFARDDIYLKAGLILLASLFLLLPGIGFGQREHQLFLLVTPYLFLVTLRARNHPIPFSLAICTGIFAGLGFALKPFFLSTFVLVELYLMVKQKSFFAWVRIESLVVTIILCGYLGVIFLYTPEYLHFMIPYATSLYLPYYFDRASWTYLYTQPEAFYCYLAILFYCLVLCSKNIKYRELAAVLALAVVGFFISYACQLMFASYHILPMVEIATLLLALIYVDYAKTILANSKLMPVLRIIFLGTILFWIPANYFGQYCHTGIQLKNRVNYQKLINYIQSNADDQPIYFFTAELSLPYPLVDDANAKFLSRFPCFWFLPSQYLTAPKVNNAINKIVPYATRKNFLIDTVTEELRTQKPKLIFLDTLAEWPGTAVDHFDYVEFFSSNPAFKQIWQNYYHATDIGRIQIYKRKHSAKPLLKTSNN